MSNLPEMTLPPAAQEGEGQIALFTQVLQIREASRVLGSKVTNIAIIEPDLTRLAEIATVLSKNYQHPGAFAEYIINVKKKRDASGRNVAIVRTGLVREGLIEWSKSNPDLMRGWKKRDIAKFFKWEMSDRRIEDFVQALTRICKDIGIKAGSDGKGGFRIYDLSQLAKKQNRRVELMGAIYRKGEEDGQVLGRRGQTPQGRVTLQPAYWEPAGGDDGDE